MVEGDPKAPFSIATTPRCRGGRYSFPPLLHFTLDPYLIMLSVKQGGIKYHFWVFGMTRPGIEPRSPGPLANTLTAIINVVKEIAVKSPISRLYLLCTIIKWYLIPLCLTFSSIRYVSRVKRSNPGKVVAPFPTPWCSSYGKGSFLVALD